MQRLGNESVFPARQEERYQADLAGTRACAFTEAGAKALAATRVAFLYNAGTFSESRAHCWGCDGWLPLCAFLLQL